MLVLLPPSFAVVVVRGEGGSRDRDKRDALVVGARRQPLFPRLLGRGPRVPGAARVELGGLALEGREGRVVGVGAFLLGVGGGRSLFFFFALVGVGVAAALLAAAALVVVVALEQLAARLRRLFVLRFGFRLLRVGAAPKVVVECTYKLFSIVKMEGERKVSEH